jgi:hypothetical protein
MNNAQSENDRVSIAGMLDETGNNSMRAKVVGLPSPRIALMTCTELLKP